MLAPVLSGARGGRPLLDLLYLRGLRTKGSNI